LPFFLKPTYRPSQRTDTRSVQSQIGGWRKSKGELICNQQRRCGVEIPMDKYGIKSGRIYIVTRYNSIYPISKGWPRPQSRSRDGGESACHIAKRVGIFVKPDGAP